jgi:uncharacterized membrane protein
MTRQTPEPTDPAPGQATASPKSAGAFDIRNFIGTLIGIYGVILTVLGLLFFTSEESRRTGGINANLIAGICMIVFALIFLVWARLRPVVITPPVESQEPLGD